MIYRVMSREFSIAMRRLAASPIFLLCAGVLLLSLAYSFYFHIPPQVDARGYDNIGWHLAQGLGYRESLDVPIERDIGMVRVGPGYQFFLAGVYKLFGHHYPPVWILQALFLSLSAFFTYLIAKEIFRESWAEFVGLIAAALVGFSPDLITVSAMLLTENVGIFCMILSVYLFLRLLRRGGWQFAFLFGVVFAVAAIVRTPAVFLFIPIAVVLLATRRWKDLVVAAFAIVMMLTPWTIRNYHLYHAFVPFSVNSGYNIYIGNHPGATGEQDTTPILTDYIDQFGIIKANQIATREGIQYILRDPIGFVRRSIVRASIYFSIARPTGFWFHLHGIAKAITLIASALYAAILFGLGFIGIGSIKKLPRGDRRRALFYSSLLFIMPLSLVGLVVETRYRFPVYPFFAIFAAYGLHLFRERKVSPKLLITVAALLGANTGFDVSENISRIFERISEL